MDSTIARLLFGTDDEQTVIKSKETEKQIRSFASGSEADVSLTDDECKKLCEKMNGFQYLPGYEGRVRQYTVTDETVDRMGDIVRAKGVRLDNYKKNPVIQFAHDYAQPPVGLSIKTWYDKARNAVKSWALFFDDRLDPTGRADLIFRLVQSNAMRACSIGFMPMAVNNPRNAEERAKIGLGDWGVEYTESDMMEFSPVPVPANPSALQEGFTKSYREGFVKNLRSGLFTAKDVDVLKEFPFLPSDALDAFIKELGTATITVPEVPAVLEEKAPIATTTASPSAAPSVIVNLSLDTAQYQQLIDSTNELREQLTKALDDIRTLITTTRRALAGGDGAEKSKSDLYREVLLNGGK